MHQKLFGESYACSHELSRFNRSGETETLIYPRKGNIFENNLGWMFEIVNESDLFLTIITSIDSSGYLVHIDKISYEFGNIFYNMDEFKENPPPTPFAYGQCIKID